MVPDLHAPDFLRNPDPVIDGLRTQGPLVRGHLPILGRVWMTTTDAAARDMLKRSSDFVRNPANADGTPLERVWWWFPPFIKPLLRNITLMDGQDHARLRGLVTQAFTSGSVERLHPTIQDIADGLIDALPTDAPADIIQAYARKLPILVICAHLGVPEEDRADIARWFAPVGRAAGVWSALRAAPGLWQMSRYFRADFERLRATPRPGIIHDLVMARQGSDRLSDDELLAMVIALFIGGSDTTVHLIGNAIYEMLTVPGLKESLDADREAWPFFIEEIMRLKSPVMFTNMYHVTRDMEFFGRQLKRGDRVVPLLIAANQDPDRFPEAQTLIHDRRPNAHLGFGAGVHMCLGMGLARAEARIAVSRLFERYPQMRMACAPNELTPLHRIGLRGWKSLPVHLAP